MEVIENIGIGVLMIIFGIVIIVFMSKRPPSYPLVSINFKVMQEVLLLYY